MWQPARSTATGPRAGTVATGSDGTSTARDSLVIIPTYNELDNLAKLVPRVLAAGPFDVLVVDDNSPDGTGALAEELAQRYTGRVAVLHRAGKLGLGTAYLAGFHYALEHGYERIFEMDADFSHEPESLPALRAALDGADVALGSRYVSGGGTKGWPLQRRLLSRGGSLYASLVLGLPYKDLTSGFKGFRRRALEALDLEAIRSNGFAFQIEVTYRCHGQGLQIVEVPIQFEDRRAGRSKMSWRIAAEALLVVSALRISRPVNPVSNEVSTWVRHQDVRG